VIIPGFLEGACPSQPEHLLRIFTLAEGSVARDQELHSGSQNFGRHSRHFAGDEQTSELHP
jgi:hypothetical protein